MRSWWILPVIAGVAGCGQAPRPGAVISEVRWGVRVNSLGTVPIELPLESELHPDSGFVSPTPGQADEGAVQLRFTLHDYTGQGRRYRYKVYYRSDTYRFPENNNAAQHPNAEENFYGSWDAEEAGFHLSPPVTENGLVVEDRFRVRSDPRNEFAKGPWQRNPRTGSYALLVVAIAEDDFLHQPPPADVLDVRMRDGVHFTEPWWYWLHGPGSRRTDAHVLNIDDALRLHIVHDQARGIHGCVSGHSQLAAFTHHIDPASRFDNIPVVADVLGNHFTPTQYDSLLAFTPTDRFVPTLPRISEAPCSVVHVDTLLGCVELRNPGCTLNRIAKENVGVQTRHAFTYGRHRIHCALSPLLNDSDLWNGLTNAVWLIDAGAPDVLNRSCSGGYRSERYGENAALREPRTSYAEIDFEIMKGMPLCPERAFPPIYPQPVADANDRSAWLRQLPLEVVSERGNVMVACTNWDMACPDPPAFGIGCHDVLLGDQAFTNHRWDRDYRAVTQKMMEADDVLFSPQGYWFEIDWRPTEIFWRIGPTLENMRTVGYMNSSMTSIPSVPMWIVVSQEFHNTTWWPGAPYQQGGIPFPEKDLVGRVFELRVD